jgi:hypothetical protein
MSVGKNKVCSTRKLRFYKYSPATKLTTSLQSAETRAEDRRDFIERSRIAGNIVVEPYCQGVIRQEPDAY